MQKIRYLRTCANFGLVICLVLLPGLAALTTHSSVTFTYLRATQQPDGSIKVEWGTASEYNTQAFNLYRSTEATVPLDAAHLVYQEPAQGSDTGAEYEYLDTATASGLCYRYLVAEVGSSGVTGSQDGPVAAGDNCNAAAATSTPTATATTGSSTATATATRTVTRTATATRTTQPAATDPPTATRQYTNTPVPPATATASPTASETPVGAGTATPLPPATIATPTSEPGSNAAPATAIPTAAPALPLPAVTPQPPEPTATATNPAPQETLELTATIAATDTPQVFAAATTGPALLDGTQRATPQPASPTAGRNNRTLLLVGGGAIVLAGLLSIVGLLIWRATRPR